MNPIRLRTRQLGLSPLSAFLLSVCFYFPGLAIANSGISGGISTAPAESVAVPSSCEPQFNPFNLIDSGVQTSIALNSSGLALEFHRAQSLDRIWYRVGKQSELD